MQQETAEKIKEPKANPEKHGKIQIFSLWISKTGQGGPDHSYGH